MEHALAEAFRVHCCIPDEITHFDPYDICMARITELNGGDVPRDPTVLEEVINQLDPTDVCDQGLLMCAEIVAEHERFIINQRSEREIAHGARQV